MQRHQRGLHEQAQADENCQESLHRVVPSFVLHWRRACEGLLLGISSRVESLLYLGGRGFDRFALQLAASVGKVDGSHASPSYYSTPMPTRRIGSSGAYFCCASWTIENPPPWGSLSTLNLPTGISVGGTRTWPPVSVTLAAVASQSATAK